MISDEKLELLFNSLREAADRKLSNVPSNGHPLRRTKDQTNYYIYISEFYDTSLLAVAHNKETAEIIAKAYERDLGCQVLIKSYKSVYAENSYNDKTIEQFRKDIGYTE